MGLNYINVNNKDVICIFHNNSKYLFVITDLIKIINSALTNSYMFFSEPLCIKNPYDNLAFTKATLYNIYFYVRFKTTYRPELLFKFFQSNFKLNLFKFRNEMLLREYIIENFVYKSSSDILLTEIKNMIIFFNKECRLDRLQQNRIYIDKDFPKDKLIKIMRPYLLLYCISQYGYLQHMRSSSLFILKKKLLEFNNFNPQFGRKRYKIVTKITDKFKTKICGKILEFNDNHINFLEKNVDEDFLTDHLTYDENYYVVNNNTNTFIFVAHDETLDYQDNNVADEDSHEDNEENNDNDVDEEEDNNDDDEDDEDDVNNEVIEQNVNTILRRDAEDELDEFDVEQHEVDSVS